MIDLKSFTEQKQEGLTTLVKTGDIKEPSFTLVKKNWNPDTGEQVEDTFTEFSRKELLERKVELEKEIKQIDGFLAEADAL